MFRNVSPFTVLSGKKYGPYTFDAEMAQNICFQRITFIFNNSVRLLSPQIRTFCLFTFPPTWNVASSLNRNLLENYHLHRTSLEITHRSAGVLCDLPVLGAVASSIDNGTFVNAYAVRATQLFGEYQAPGSLSL